MGVMQTVASVAVTLEQRRLLMPSDLDSIGGIGRLDQVLAVCSGTGQQGQSHCSDGGNLKYKLFRSEGFSFTVRTTNDLTEM